MTYLLSEDFGLPVGGGNPFGTRSGAGLRNGITLPDLLF
jgi:hypothetical protein